MDDASPESCSCPAYTQIQTRVPLRFTSMCDRATPWLKRSRVVPQFNYNSMSSTELAQQVVPKEFPKNNKIKTKNKQTEDASTAAQIT